MSWPIQCGPAVVAAVLIVACFGCGSGNQKESTAGEKPGATASPQPASKAILEKLHSTDESSRIEGAKAAVEKFGTKPQGGGK
jgi:hypothetical protein